MMDVLLRKRGESVAVGGENPFERLLTITVLEIEGDSVTLAIEATADAPFYPLEEWEDLRPAGRPCDPKLSFGVVGGHC